MASYTDWLASAGIRPETYAGYSADEKDAILGAYNQNVEQTTGVGIGDTDWLSMKGSGGLALGGLQAGIGLMGTLDAMKTAKMQRSLLGQQYNTNAEKLQSWRDSNANVKSAFSGGGLASSGL